MIKAIQIAYDEHFEIRCKMAATAGFRNIAVNFDGMKDRSKGAWEKAPETIRRVLEENRLRSVQSHLPYYHLFISSEILDEEMEDAIRNSIRVSGMIGTPWCVYHPRSSVSTGYRSSQALLDNQRVISGYLELAASCGTGIALENLPTYYDRFASVPFYTCNYEDLSELNDSLKADNVSVCWDTGHAHMLHLDQADAIRFMGDRIKCTHIHSNFRREDLHLPVDYGTVQWDQVMKAFADIGYEGPFTLETHWPEAQGDLTYGFACYNLAGLNYLETVGNDKKADQ